MKTYIVTYGIHVNCVIRATCDYVVRADDLREAHDKADELAKAIELVQAAEWRTSDGNQDRSEPDFWAAVEEVHEI